MVFCCIGTTKAKSPNKAFYRAIDYGIPVEATKLCKQNSINQFIVISALGANAESKIMYSQLKGEMERDVLAKQIEHTHLLQPSLIVASRNEKRMGEDVSKFKMKPAVMMSISYFFNMNNLLSENRKEPLRLL